MIEELGSYAIPMTNGSGSGSRRLNNMWIRIRIRNAGAKIAVKIYFASFSNDVNLCLINFFDESAHAY